MLPRRRPASTSRTRPTSSTSPRPTTGSASPAASAKQMVDAAASIGAKGLIVHGGHVNKADDPEKGFDNWRKAVEATDLKFRC